MLFTFKKGGVHPKDSKYSAKKEIVQLKTPDYVQINLNQHIGAPAKAIVKIGDSVKKGQVIAEPTSFVSSYIHSSITGQVSKIENNFIKIDKTEESEDYIKLEIEGKNLSEIVKLAGIVGKGGAGFPTHVKISPQNPETIDSIIINGAECEPYLSSDHRIMIERSLNFIEAIKIVQKHFQSKPKVYIGIEINKTDAIDKLNKLLANETNIVVCPLKTRYPQGGEKQLIQAILKREVPTDKLPFHIGVIVLNVGTILAIYDAVINKKPLFETTVTISGDCINEAKNYIIPVGTTLNYIIEQCLIDKNKISKIILGGPMMGNSVSDTSLGINKTCSGILFFSKTLSLNERDCINCGMCADVCSLGLIPTKFAKFSKINNMEDALAHNIMDCTECGCCSYICPAKIEIVQWIKLLKNNIRNKKKDGK